MRAVALLVLAAALPGCGSAAQQHRTLNTLTDIADPTFEEVVVTCDEARDAIVLREGTNYAEDRADFDRVNAACDRAVAGFELLADGQRLARAAVDAGASGVAQAAIANAVDAWNELRALIPELLGGL